MKNESKAFIIVKTADARQQCFKRVPLEDIIYCESFNSSVTFVLKNKLKIISTNLSLKKCENTLNVFNGFFRVHNKIIANLFNVIKYIPAPDGGKLELKEGHSVKVARNRKEDFLNAFYEVSENTVQ